jgi:pyruvate dehydrogenase E1 component alpha subunit
MGHSMSDPVHGHYRTKEEVEEQKLKDPIRHHFKRLSEQGLLDQAGFERIDAEVRAVVDAAVAFADASPEPPANALYENVYAEPYGPYTLSK